MLCFFGDLGKFRSPDQQRPEKHHRSEDQVRRLDPEDLASQIGLIRSGELLRCDLLGCKLDAGKDEQGAGESAGDIAQRVERLREIEPAL